MKSYKDKKFSILGDSISTLDWYSQPEYAAFYQGARKFEANVFAPEDTWWGKVIDCLEGRLLVNNSFSGSTVCKLRGCAFPSYGCSDERTSDLSKDGCMPDVIMVYMGTNDWGCNVRPIAVDPEDKGDLSIFSVAYQSMLKKLYQNYPQAEIWCFTLSVSAFSKSEEFVFPYRYKGRHIEEYCKVIRECAQFSGCKVIDLYSWNEPYDTIDGFHPNSVGMQTLADAVISQLKKDEL